MAKMSDLSLEELYAKPKMTPSVEIAIRFKEDFSKIQPNYCEKVCKLNCKSPYNVSLLSEQVDILIIQDHKALPDLKYGKEASRLEKTNRTIIDELTRINFVDPTTGKILKAKIVEVTKCSITEADIKKGKPPLTSTLTKCVPYLLHEIKVSNPKVIISLTTNATKALGIAKSNYSNRGEICKTPEGVPVVLTLHPKIALMIRQNSSGAMWGSDYWDVISRDFNKAARLALGQLQIPTLEQGIQQAKGQISVCRTLEDVKRAVETLLALPKGMVASFDTETTGLDPWTSDARLITIQFGYRTPHGVIHSLVIPLWHRENKGYNPDEAWKLVKQVLESDVPKVGHNVKFDILYIYGTTGVKVNKVVFDTMLVLHNINSGIQGNYGLKMAVWDWIPESGLGGYEDKLPSLSKKSELQEEEEVEDA